MKKLVILLCVILAALPVCASAQSDFTVVCGDRPVLSLQYDEAVFGLDTESYLTGSIGGHIWLGMLFNRTSTIEMAADLYPDLPDGCTPEQLSAYLCLRLENEQCEPLEIYTPKSKIPFAILSLNGLTGPSYYAAVLSQGYVVYFEIYNLLGGVGPQDLITLKTLLDTVALQS